VLRYNVAASEVRTRAGCVLQRMNLLTRPLKLLANMALVACTSRLEPMWVCAGCAVFNLQTQFSRAASRAATDKRST
jgi:hypothetical protein